MLLIQAFAQINKDYPNSVLLLKSLTDLYPQGVGNIEQAILDLAETIPSQSIVW